MPHSILTPTSTPVFQVARGPGATLHHGARKRHTPVGRGKEGWRDGKQFLGAIVERDDGERWVLDYDEQSRYHAFAERRVTVTGVAYTPAPQGQVDVWAYPVEMSRATGDTAERYLWICTACSTADLWERRDRRPAPD